MDLKYALNIPHLYNKLPNAYLDFPQLSLCDLIEFFLSHIIGLKSFVDLLFILYETNAVQDCLVDVRCLNQLVFTNVDFYLVGADVERDCFESEVEKFQMTFSVWKEGGLFASRELLVVEVVHVLQEVDNEFWIFVSYLVFRIFRLIFDDRSC